ncbi:MAG: GMC oxidoreductase, partial [Bacteroidota bacterium]
LISPSGQLIDNACKNHKTCISHVRIINKFNQKHACKNVFVTDGAAMTSASCVNPSLTYMALTARAADYAFRGLKNREL